MKQGLSMSKTILSLLIFSIGLNIYFYTTDVFVFDDFEVSIPSSMNDSVHLAQSAVDKELLKENSKDFEHNRTQQYWFELSNELFEKKLKLTQSKISLYHELRSQRSVELDNYIIPKLDEHYESNGEGAPYILTMQDSVFMGKLNQKYMEKFKTLIGSGAFDEYQKLKSSFNRELTLKNKKELLIDF